MISSVPMGQFRETGREPDQRRAKRIYAVTQRDDARNPLHRLRQHTKRKEHRAYDKQREL